MQIKHTEAFDLAYRFVNETNLNIFLTGKAGTGKTTFLKYLRENSYKKMIVAAPTGVAAINAGGVTLHSLFQLPFAPFIPSKETNSNAVNSHSLISQIRYSSEKLSLLRNLELLVIDEASMVAMHTVDAIDTILKSVRRKHNVPFGGTQVLFIGDLHQLPPVVKNQEWSFLKSFYSSVFFFDSLVLKENIPVMVELKEIFRQQDPVFIEVLNEIRNNKLTRENFALLNSRLQRNFATSVDDGYITLTTHNYQADEINKRELKKLSSNSNIYKAEIFNDFPEHLYPAEKELELKAGAQVMFLKNDLDEKKYFNGKIGVITALNATTIKVKCKGDQHEIEVHKEEWKNVKYSLNSETRAIKEELLGTFRQYPLRLAWAITIHKSQGLTFNKLIIDAENAFANGQVYVALSRCTSLEGLILTSPINQRFLGAHQNLKDWQEKNQDDKNLPHKFTESRQKYMKNELLNIFSWKNLYFDLRELNDIITGEKEKLPPECLLWMDELIQKEKELYRVSEKFKIRIEQISNENILIEKNQQLQQRIKDASNYFSSEILKWKEKFHNHPLSTDIKKTARKMDASLVEINCIVNEILQKINHCKNGFLLSEYLENGKKITASTEKIQSSYAQYQIENKPSQELEHALLYGRVSEMRKQIANKINKPLYIIFSNKAIANLCAHLPLSKNALYQVKGFGKSKVNKYGDELIEIVSKYCKEKNLNPLQNFKKESDRVEKSPTVLETLKYFNEGKSIEEIARERNLAVGTIEGHIAVGIKHDSIQIEKLIPMEEVKTISKHFPKKRDFIQLSAIKESLPDVSYGKLKMVLAWLEKGN